MPLYLDTYQGSIEITLTGKETTSFHGVKFVEVMGWLREPAYVEADRISANPDFSHRTIQRMRDRDAMGV